MQGDQKKPVETRIKNMQKFRYSPSERATSESSPTTPNISSNSRFEELAKTVQSTYDPSSYTLAGQTSFSQNLQSREKLQFIQKKNLNHPTQSQAPLPTMNMPTQSQAPLPTMNMPTQSQMPLPTMNMPTQSQMPLPTMNMSTQSQMPLPTMNMPTQSQMPLPTINMPNQSQGMQATINMQAEDYLGTETQSAFQQSTINMNPSESKTRFQNQEIRRTGFSGSTLFPGNITKKDPLHLLNKMLVGKYEIVDFIGQGGMGAVYLGIHRLLGKKRAIKMLPKTANTDPSLIERFIKEARTAALVSHKNVVQVHDIEETPEYYFIVMEYVQGEGLDSYMKRKQILSKEESVKIIIASAAGLQAIHAHELIHRDIKPANLLLTKEGDIKITDFGIVKEIGANTQLTATGAILGTPHFMAPEQIKKVNLGLRCDIYSLGATFYYLITGKNCFEGTAMQLIYQVIQAEPIPVHEVCSEIDISLSNIIAKMLAKDPNDRYCDMGEVIQVLTPYL